MATLRGVGEGGAGGLGTNLFERYGQMDRQTDSSCIPHSLLKDFEPRLYIYRNARQTPILVIYFSEQ